MAALAIPLAVAALLEERPADDDAVVKGALVLVAGDAPLLLDLADGLDHARQPLDALGLGVLVDAGEVVGGELAAAANLDGTLDGQAEDGLHPLVPRLSLVDGPDDAAVGVDQVDNGLDGLLEDALEGGQGRRHWRNRRLGRHLPGDNGRQRLL